MDSDLNWNSLQSPGQPFKDQKPRANQGREYVEIPQRLTTDFISHAQQGKIVVGGGEKNAEENTRKNQCQIVKYRKHKFTQVYGSHTSCDICETATQWMPKKRDTKAKAKARWRKLWRRASFRFCSLNRKAQKGVANKGKVVATREVKGKTQQTTDSWPRNHKEDGSGCQHHEAKKCRGKWKINTRKCNSKIFGTQANNKI